MTNEKDYTGATASLLGEIARAATEGPNRIARTEVDSLVVSTVDSGDCGPETAIISYEGTYPVERYETIAEAKKGHDKWVNIVSDPQFDGKILELGYMGVIEDQEIELF